MAEYTYSEIMRMQNDAIKRVEDMQRKARKTAGLEKSPEETQSASDSIQPQEPKRVTMPNDYLEKLRAYATNSSYHGDDGEIQPTPEKKDERTTEKRKPNALSFKSENAFGELNIDEDKALLLALILLLSEEKGDELLIMALIYMLT